MGKLKKENFTDITIEPRKGDGHAGKNNAIVQNTPNKPTKDKSNGGDKK